MIRILIFCFFTLTNLSVFAQARVSWPEGKVHDFGKVKGPQEYTFMFKNEGTTSLTVETTRTTCGCTAASFDQKPVPPGETGRIKVEFDGEVPIGNRFKKKVKVFFLEKKRPETLVVKGSVL